MPRNKGLAVIVKLYKINKTPYQDGTHQRDHKELECEVMIYLTKICTVPWEHGYILQMLRNKFSSLGGRGWSFYESMTV